MRVLITGGLGYLGGRISHALLNMGVSVKIGSSRRSPIVPASLNNAEVVYIDLLDTNLLDYACKNVDCIIHLAAMDARSCERYPELALTINGLGTLNLLKSAKKNCITRILYVSTIHIYGSELSGYIDESSLPAPGHHYSITHRLAEEYLFEASNHCNLSGTVFRLSNSFGIPLTDTDSCWSLVVNDFCKQAVSDRTIILKTMGSQYRDFIPIKGVVNAVKCWLEDDNIDGVFNLGDKAYSIYNMAIKVSEHYEELFGFKVDIVVPESKNKHHDGNNILSYSHKKLNKMCAQHKSYFDGEIDELLIFLHEQ